MPLFRRAWLLAVVLAASARAAVVVAPTTVYSAPSGAWSGPLASAFSNPATLQLLPPGLGLTGELTPELLKRAAPLIAKLEGPLETNPEAFKALPAKQQAAAIELAVDEAREELRLKIYAEAENARRLASQKGLDKHQRKELYATVARLMEMREHYQGWFLNPEREEDEPEAPELAALAEAYAAAAGAAWRARTDLLDPGALDAPAAKTAVTVPAASGYVLKPGKAATKLREDMENNKSGWGQDDLDTLYVGFDFVRREGKKHRFYTHPVFPQLHDSVSRQNDLPPGYSMSALKLIAELERLTAAPQADAGGTAAAAFPATLTLADLSVLLSPPSKKEPEAKPKPLEEIVARGPPKEKKKPLVEVKTSPEEPAVEIVPKQARLDPPTERPVEEKPEVPAPQTAAPKKSWIKSLWPFKTKPD